MGLTCIVLHLQWSRNKGQCPLPPINLQEGPPILLPGGVDARPPIKYVPGGPKSPEKEVNKKEMREGEDILAH